MLVQFSKWFDKLGMGQVEGRSQEFCSDVLPGEQSS